MKQRVYGCRFCEEEEEIEVLIGFCPRHSL